MRNRLIGIAIGLAAGLSLLLWQADRRSVPSWNLLPENRGTIRTIAFHYTRASAAVTGPCLWEFLYAIPYDVELVAVCGDRDDAAAFRHDLRCSRGGPGRSVRVIVVDKPITGWCKDRFLVARDGRLCLITPKPPDTATSSRSNDGLSAPAIARAFPNRFRAVRTPIRFDAGDILATRDRIIVSDELLRKNGGFPTLAREVERVFGRKTVLLRGVPAHHIGMFAAPLNGRTVMVGDPDLARSIWTKKMEAKLGRADFSEAAVRPFHRAASQLESAGFRVIRVPTVYIAPQVYVTYTNGVFETRNGKRIAYVPTYGVPEMDGLALAAYRSAGWQVRPIRVGDLYRCRGTIGCLVNVLERSDD